jgi:RNA polymerase sigma factor (sigma-70 family)
LDRLENILMGIGLKEGYTRLTKREKNIIILYYLEGYKDEEIAKLYGVCQQNINRQRKRGIAKIKIVKYF